MSTPKMYSSFIPNGQAEPHLHTPLHQGLPLGDPDLSLSQVGFMARSDVTLIIINKCFRVCFVSFHSGSVRTLGFRS